MKLLSVHRFNWNIFIYSWTGCKLEIAVSGTAVPVDITVNPGAKFLFGECNVGDHVDALCSVTNNSPLLPTSFSTKPLAHFHPKPYKAVIKPSSSVDVMISFKPRQLGTFDSKLEINFLGAILDPVSQPSSAHIPLAYKQVVIHTLHILLHGVCDGPGVPLKTAAHSTGAKGLPSAVSSPRACDVRERRHGAQIAQPNDRATSIRPADRQSKIR